MIAILILVVLVTWIPLFLVYRARGNVSTEPRIQLILDMDKQPRRGPQTGHPWFVDGRAMRQPVAGTIARGQLQVDDHYFRGFTIVRNSETGQEKIEFATTLPPQLSSEADLLGRGRQQFEIFCSLCHGSDGLGNGPINRRAVELQEPKWVPATNLMTQEIRDRADGQIFQAISDGVRNMPSYASQIKPRERWAIVAYLRGLQARSPVAPAAKK
jgi:mono/diheme cytochrome c family protein